eukprot:432070_1
MKNLKNTRLHLCHNGYVIGSDSIFTSGSGDNDLRYLGATVDGLMGEIEIESHGSSCSLLGSGHGPAEDGGGGSTVESALHHDEIDILGVGNTTKLQLESGRRRS